jgi:hypothetical protein
MCNFASFILTKDKAYWYASDSHEDIIEQHSIRELDQAGFVDIVRVELTPPDHGHSDLSTWDYRVDQDVMPTWTYKSDPGLEQRARKALEQRAADERWFMTDVGDSAHVGYRGKATAGDCGTASAGVGGTATVGDCGTATVGDEGTATAGYGGTATAGDRGTATAGDRGTATVGDEGTATAGYGGTATAGRGGTATAGRDGTASAGARGILQIRYVSGGRRRVAVGYVGENGIKPNTAYKVAHGRLVEA